MKSKACSPSLTTCKSTGSLWRATLSRTTSTSARLSSTRSTMNLRLDGASFDRSDEARGAESRGRSWGSSQLSATEGDGTVAMSVRQNLLTEAGQRQGEIERGALS